MCKTYESTITVIFNIDSDSWNVWVTDGEQGSQLEILAFLTDVPVAIRNAFFDLRNEVLRESHS
jgi:hypothetical protein